MKEMTKAKLIFWGAIFLGAVILPLFLFVIIGNWAWLVWGVLILVFIIFIGFQVWLASKIKEKINL